MFRRFLFVSVGTLALLASLAAPGQVQAQHMGRGMGHPAFRGRMMPGFRGGFDRRHDRFMDRRFDERFFEPRFNGRFFFEPRIDSTFNRGRFIDPLFFPR